MSCLSLLSFSPKLCFELKKIQVIEMQEEMSGLTLKMVYKIHFRNIPISSHFILKHLLHSLASLASAVLPVAKQQVFFLINKCETTHTQCLCICFFYYF